MLVLPAVRSDLSVAFENPVLLCVQVLGRGDRDRAMSLFRLAIKMDPTRADYLMNLGITLVMDHDYKRARVAFQVALALHPGHSCTIKNLVDLDERERAPVLELPGTPT